MKNSVVEKYSDQAHFIYELLQNADDAKATSASFVLHEDKLIFAHNGTRRFSVSNSATEAEDSANDALGDINAITSIANSNKFQKNLLTRPQYVMHYSHSEKITVIITTGYYPGFFCWKIREDK